MELVAGMVVIAMISAVVGQKANAWGQYMGGKNVRISFEKIVNWSKEMEGYIEGDMGSMGEFSFLNISKIGACLYADEKQLIQRKKLTT